MQKKQSSAKSRRNHGYSVSLHKASARYEWSCTVGYDENGKQRRARGYALTQALAVEAAQAALARHRKGGCIPTSKDSTVCEYLDAWLEEHVKPSTAPKTYGFYDANIRRHLNPFIGRIKLRQLRAMDIQAIIAQRRDEGLSSSTLHGILRTIRAALTVAWKNELVEQNVAKKVTMPKLERQTPGFLEPEQASALIAASKGHVLHNLIVFALATGVRLGEASGLTWDCINLDRKEARIMHQLQRIDGTLMLRGLKSTSSRRTLPLASLAVEALREEKARQLVLSAALGNDFNPLNIVFLNSEARPLDQRYVDRHLKEILVKAGLPKLSFHKLRHTAASLLVAAGVDIHQVKEQLGHSQISLTANLYAHGVSQAQRRAANKLDSVLRTGDLLD
jgi:integrase